MAYRTGEMVRCDHHKLREVLYNRGVVGIAEATYPHPRGWTFEEVNECITLDRLMTVQWLTRAFKRRNSRAPNSEAKWYVEQMAMREGETPFGAEYGSRSPTPQPPIGMENAD